MEYTSSTPPEHRCGCLIPSGTSSSTGTRRAPPLFAARLRTRSKHWRNAVALCWGGLDAELPGITLEQDGTSWTFRIDGAWLRFDWIDGAVSYEPE